MRKLFVIAAGLALGGCFKNVAPPEPENYGLLVADGLTEEPAFDVEYERGSGRSIFSWTSVTGSSTSVVTIAAVEQDGRIIWKASPMATETRGPLQYEARVAVSSANVYASWDEYLLGSFSLNGAVLSADGVQLPMKARVHKISRVNRDKNVMIAAEGNSAALAWEDYDPVVNTTYIGVAELGPGGLRWVRLLGGKEEGERYLDPVLAATRGGGLVAAYRHLHNGDNRGAQVQRRRRLLGGRRAGERRGKL